MKKESICINEDRNVLLTAYIQETDGEFAPIGKRPAVLILPGGGYQMCSEREADPVAFPYLKAGYHVCILRYSVGQNATWPQPLSDYEAAMELIKSRSEEWKLYPDKIAVVGFSAGGHLAGAAATMAKNRPAAAILGYAVLNDEVKDCNPTAPSLIKEVDGHTCPCFIFASRTDTIVPVANSLEFMQALEQNGISFESHIYAYGPHGFSICESPILDPNASVCARVPNWVQDSIGWLKDVLGDFKNGEMTEPVCRLNLNADSMDVLSVDCTLGYLMSKPLAKELIQEIMQQASSSHSAQRAEGMNLEASMKMAEKMTFREVLAFGNTSKEMVEQLDRRLRAIPNN